jgi:hypothetical protein
VSEQEGIRVPASDCDLLTGRDQIAAWFGITEGQCSARINSGEILTFKAHGRTTVYASKRENLEYWERMRREYRNHRNQNAPTE